PLLIFSLSILLPPPLSTLFPYTTLFRSSHQHHRGGAHCFADWCATTNIRRATNPERTTKNLRIDAAAPEAEDLVPVTSHQHAIQDRKSTRLNSSHRTISYAVFCLKKKNQ